MFKDLKETIDAYLARDPAAQSALEVLLLYPGVKAVQSHRRAHWFYEHDMKFIMNCCNRILVLNFGKKIAEGTPEEIKNNEEVQTAYFGKGLVTGEATK